MDDSALAKAVALWQLEGDPVLVRHVQNRVYAVKTAEGPAFLRLGYPAHRSVVQTDAELRFVAHLVSHGFPAAEPLASTNGSALEVIETDHEVVNAAVFRACSGHALAVPADFTPKVFEAWGEVMGHLHRLSATFQPAPDGPRRFAWHDADELTLGTGQWPEGLAEDDYGLVHGDLNESNLMKDGERLQVFDFDDCCYHWYAYDISAALYSVWFEHDFAGTAFDTGAFLQPFLRGYRRERAFTSSAEARLPQFLRYRVALLQKFCLVPGTRPAIDRLDPQNRAELLAWARLKLQAL